MIDVVIYQNSNSDYIGFTTNGHAGSDDPGHDIVCSAVSAIAITILNSIEELSDVSFTLDCDQESGNMDFMFKESPDIKAQTLIQEIDDLHAEIIDSSSGKLLDHLMEKQSFTLRWD